MRSAEILREAEERSGRRAASSSGHEPTEIEVQAWEELEAGRYRPLRTRGSFPGRELG